MIELIGCKGNLTHLLVSLYNSITLFKNLETNMAYKLEDLEAWKKGRSFRKEISLLCKKLPKEEKFRLIDQLIRASRSITANIAEGHGRYHYQENIQFCRQARGSLLECKDHLYCALDEGFID